MNWLFSRALVEAFSADTCSAGAASALSSGTHTPQAFLSPDRMTAFSRPSRFGMTFGPLTADLGAAVLTWCLVDSLARTSASQGRATDSTASEAASGQKWRGSLARYDHDSRSWRTAQHSLLGGSDEFSETWPRWGTTRAGELFLLPTPALPICANASGLWRTPAAREPGISPERLQAIEGGELGGMNRHFDKHTGRMAQIGLSQQVKLRQQWPTPNASDNRDRGNMSDPAVQRRVALGKQIGLSMAVKEGPATGSLNPTWVEWLMGWPLGWTDLQPSATDKYRTPLLSHGDCSEVA